jgi:hypothetical protein
LTVQAVVPLVIVTVLPLIEQPPLTLIVTARPELAVAATLKLVPYVAFAGAGVVTVIVCESAAVVKLRMLPAVVPTEFVPDTLK